MLNFQFVIAKVKFLLIFEMWYLSFAHECIYSTVYSRYINNKPIKALYGAIMDNV